MSQKKDKPQSPSWWQTLPGIMTAMGAIITALTGLLIALTQAGIIGSQGQPASQSRNNKPSISVPTEAALEAPTLTPRAAQKPATPTEEVLVQTEPTDIVPAGPAKATPALPHAAGTPHYPLVLASGGEAAVAEQVYTVMAAQIERRSTDRLGLRITLRMINNDRFSANFSERSARLLVGGLPFAPINPRMWSFPPRHSCRRSSCSSYPTTRPQSSFRWAR